MNRKIVTIVGGTGFVGRYVVTLLAKQGYTVRVISRHPNAALHLKTAGDVGQIVLQGGNLAIPESMNGKLDGSYAVVNLAGILFEKGRQDFSAIHSQGAERLAKAAKVAGAKRFVQISAIGVDHSVKSKYARTKALGEKAVKAAFPEATIIRPSVIFGPEDNFFNKFAQMARLLPVLPLFGDGKTKFQPVYVGDVAQAIVNAITRDDLQGQTYELGGPNVMNLRDVYQTTLEYAGIKRNIISLPYAVGGFMSLFSFATPELLSITRDQLKLLQYDNVVSEGAKTLYDMGIDATPVEVVVPTYLSRHKKAA